MKALYNLSFIIVFFLISSCDKESLNKNTDLLGKWNLTETLADPGNGSGKWRAVSKNEPVSDVEFKESGELQGSYFDGYIRYKLKDSVTFTVIKKDKSEQNYRFNIKGNELSISPAGPLVCFEACGSRFVKID